MKPNNLKKGQRWRITDNDNYSLGQYFDVISDPCKGQVMIRWSSGREYEASLSPGTYVNNYELDETYLIKEILKGYES